MGTHRRWRMGDACTSPAPLRLLLPNHPKGRKNSGSKKQTWRRHDTLVILLLSTSTFSQSAQPSLSTHWSFFSMTHDMHHAIAYVHNESLPPSSPKKLLLSCFLLGQPSRKPLYSSSSASSPAPALVTRMFRAAARSTMSARLLSDTLCAMVAQYSLLCMRSMSRSAVLETSIS